MRLAIYGLIAVCVVPPTATSAQTASAGQRVAETPTEREKDVASAHELVNLANALADLRRFDEAITAYTLALKQDPNDGIVLANRALSYAWINKVDEAEQDLRAAERVLPDVAVLHRVRAIIANRRSDEDTELTELTKSLMLDPGNPFALSFRASIYQGRKLYEAALADAEAYIRARPEEPEAYEMKAGVLADQRKWDEAAAQAELLKSQFSRDPKALASAANIYRRLGRRAEALEAIDRAIALNDGFFYFWKLRAGMRRRDDFGGRGLDLREALDLAPGDMSITTNLGLLAVEQEHWSDARARFSEVIAKEPRDFGVLAYRAMTELKLGLKTEGEKDFANAKAVASGIDDLARICGMFGREGIALDWGLATCNQAILAKPDRGGYLAARGLIRLRLGDLTGAIADYDRAIAKDDTLDEAFYGRAIAHFRQGNFEGAESDRNSALKLDPTVEESFVAHKLGDLAGPHEPIR